MAATPVQGLIIVNTGNGKGKTTAALGLALRAAGQGLRVLILQFMKGQKTVGEYKALQQTTLPITIRQLGRAGFVHSRACEALDIAKAHRGLDLFREALDTGRYDMIILDEINVAVSFGLLEIEDVLSTLASRPKSVHVVLTGRNAHEKVVAMADLVTEMREVKHPFQKHIKAQKGIEF